jgi:hypothetical protein
MSKVNNGSCALHQVKSLSSTLLQTALTGLMQVNMEKESAITMVCGSAPDLFPLQVTED